MTALYLLYSLIILIILSVIILFFRKKTKNKFVTYDEAIKKIISLAPEINIVRISTTLSKERQSSYWRYIINRHFFSNYNTSEDYDYRHIKIKTFNEKQFGRISIKNLNSFINIMKQEAKKDLELFAVNYMIKEEDEKNVKKIMVKKKQKKEKK